MDSLSFPCMALFYCTISVIRLLDLLTIIIDCESKARTFIVQHIHPFTHFTIICFLETDASSQSKSNESAKTLERTKDELLKQRELLEQKLQEGSLLDPKEERR